MEKSLRYISSGFSLSQTHKHVGCCKGKPCPCTDPVWVSLQSGDMLDMVLQREGQTTGFISVPSGVFIPRPYTTLSCSLPPHSVCCGYQKERRRKKVLSSHVFSTVGGFVFCQCWRCILGLTKRRDQKRPFAAKLVLERKWKGMEWKPHFR